jgi:hypothetical protein
MSLRQVQTIKVDVKEDLEMQKAIGSKQKNTRSNNGLGSTRKDVSESKVLEVMFIHNDEEDSVEVVESAVIDFYAVIEHLRRGNAVFIAPKNYGARQEDKIPSSDDDRYYVTHI